MHQAAGGGGRCALQMEWFTPGSLKDAQEPEVLLESGTVYFNKISCSLPPSSPKKCAEKTFNFY